MDDPVSKSVSMEDNEHESEPQSDSINKPQLERKITNPFRLRQLAREQAAEQSRAEASNSNKGSIVLQPPVKSVFKDLQSAHSSITSGHGRIRGDTIPNRPTFSQDTSEQSREFSSSAQRRNIQEVPPPPVPVAFSTESAFVDVELGAPREQFDIESEDGPKARPSTFSQIITALSRTASKASRAITPTNRYQAQVNDDNSVYPSNATASSSLPSPEGGNQQPENRINRLPLDELCLPEMQFSSSPAAADTQLQARPIDASASTSTSFPDGSTVGEIYRQYGATLTPQERRPNGVSNLGYGSDTSETGLSFGQQAYDTSPGPSVEQIARHSEQSSYGDSQILLGEPAAAQSLSQPIGLEQVYSEHTMSVAVSTVPSLSAVNWRNRYSATPDTRLARDESFKSMHLERSRVASLAFNIPRVEEPAVETRVPLERQVSAELRRVSAISDGDDSVYDRFEPAYNQAHNGYGNSTTRRHGSDKLDSYHTSESLDTVRPSESALDFYNPYAIPLQWVGADQIIRVPIVRPPIPERSPRRPPPPSVTPVSLEPRISEDTSNEWETIGGSVRDRESFTRGVHRTGSSIADTSDAGDLSILSEQPYSSVERFAQHPAPISGCDNYRMKDLPGNASPVLLPVYSEYRVNGYPANSSRLRPPQPVYQDPTPLRRHHEHPFSSCPPEVLSPSRQSKIYDGKNFKGRARNQFPPTSSTFASDGSGTTGHRADSCQKRNTDRTTRVSETYEWMKNTVTPSSGGDRRDVEPGRDGPRKRPTSWGLISAHANGEEVPGYRVEGNCFVPIADHWDGIDEEEEVVNVPPKVAKTIKPRAQLPVGDFKYRSPLAAPKTKEARDLYTQERLIELEDLARNNDGQQNRIISSPSEGPSQRHLDEAPVLNTFERGGEMHPLEETTWNRACFWVTAFLPPLLLCFGLGVLDSLLEWKTRGRLQAFKRDYKRFALMLFFLELVVSIAAAAIYTGLSASSAADPRLWD